MPDGTGHSDAGAAARTCPRWRLSAENCFRQADASVRVSQNSVGVASCSLCISDGDDFLESVQPRLGSGIRQKGVATTVIKESGSRIDGFKYRFRGARTPRT